MNGMEVINYLNTLVQMINWLHWYGFSFIPAGKTMLKGNYYSKRWEH